MNVFVEKEAGLSGGRRESRLQQRLKRSVGSFEGFLNSSDMGFLLIYSSYPLYQRNSTFFQLTAMMMGVILQ